MDPYKERDIAKHVQLLTILIAAGTIIFSSGLLIGALVLLPAVFFFPALDGAARGPLEMGLLGLGSMGVIIGIANLVLGLSAAYGLYKRRPWGRILGIIDSIFSLISFPLGTILGAYGLWVLIPDDAAEYVGCCDEKDFELA